MDRVAEDILHESHDEDALEQLATMVETLAVVIDEVLAFIRYANNNRLDEQKHLKLALTVSMALRQQALKHAEDVGHTVEAKDLVSGIRSAWAGIASGFSLVHGKPENRDSPIGD